MVHTVVDVFHFWFSMIGWLCQTPAVETDALMAFVSGLQDWFGADGAPGAEGVQRGSEGSDGSVRIGQWENGIINRVSEIILVDNQIVIAVAPAGTTLSIHTM